MLIGGPRNTRVLTWWRIRCIGASYCGKKNERRMREIGHEVPELWKGQVYRGTDACGKAYGRIPQQQLRITSADNMSDEWRSHMTYGFQVRKCVTDQVIRNADADMDTDVRYGSQIRKWDTDPDYGKYSDIIRKWSSPTNMFYSTSRKSVSTEHVFARFTRYSIDGSSTV
jgi:hypothetical protein